MEDDLTFLCLKYLRSRGAGSSQLDELQQQCEQQGLLGRSLLVSSLPRSFHPRRLLQGERPSGMSYGIVGKEEGTVSPS